MWGKVFGFQVILDDVVDFYVFCFSFCGLLEGGLLRFF